MKVFLCRLKNSDDRDCCAYIENRPMRWECGHYFGSPILHGSCYCNSDYAAYDEIETVLTEDEYKAFLNFAEAINDLGFGITEGDERYQRGVELCKAIQPVYDKLNSGEAADFYKEIKKSEDELLMDEYGLDEGDIETIFDNYGLDYHGRSVVSTIFKDSEECGYEEALSLGYIKDDDIISSRYFDYARFGEDLLEDEQYVELSDGRVAYLMY